MLKALDLFCCAGGATKGLQRAGFHVTGVDIKPQKRYCGDKFHQADALVFPLEGYDFIWASPPCQAHSRLNGINNKSYPDFIGPIRDRLLKTGKPFVIENVAGAPLSNYRILCGSMFGLGVWRHRIFEPHGFNFESPSCQHKDFPEPLDVTGTGGPCSTRKTGGGGLHRKPKNMKQASLAMGIDWMTRLELVESIPPAYSEYIGRALYATK